MIGLWASARPEKRLTCDPDAETKWSGKNLPAPPYELELSIVSMAYLVPASRLQPLIPKELKLSAFLGKAVLIVLGAHYTGSRAVSTDSAGPCYNEIGYATLVSYEGALGGYFLRIHLDSKVAMELGTQKYGFPKTLAEMSYKTDGEKVTFGSRTSSKALLGAFTVKRKTGLVSNLLGQAATVMTKVTGFLVKGAYFMKPKSLIGAQMALEPASVATPVSLVYANFPYLRKKGWLTAKEASAPLGAFLYDRARMTLGRPKKL